VAGFFGNIRENEGGAGVFFEKSHDLVSPFPTKPTFIMPKIVRFSVSLEDDLRTQFDAYCKAGQFATRSEAIRQLLRERLTEQAWESDCQDAAGTLTLVYDHHRPQLRDHLTQLQHDNTELVISTMHTHLTHDLCLEVIVLRGPAQRLQKIASQLRGLKGILKGELVMASAEEHGHKHL
jgi:CopG family nickel-responsive transcriptional regulator